MSWFKKKKEEVKSKITDTQIAHKIVKEWDDVEGNYIYVHYYGMEYTYKDGSKSMSRYYQQEFMFNNDGWIQKGYGDLTWAKRQAKHYEIEIQK